MCCGREAKGLAFSRGAALKTSVVSVPDGERCACQRRARKACEGLHLDGGRGDAWPPCVVCSWFGGWFDDGCRCEMKLVDGAGNFGGL